jgi:hypothetical protein
VPLCPDEHLNGPGAQHRGAERAFWRRVGIDPFAIATALYEEFLASHPAKSSGRPKEAARVKPATDSGVKVRRSDRKRRRGSTRRVAIFAALPAKFRQPGVRPVKRRVANRVKRGLAARSAARAGGRSGR